jgi:lambda repressor-like predicted transcriptional regulator
MVTDTPTTTRPTPRPHPCKAVLVMRREPINVLAAAVGVNANTLGRVLNGFVSPWPQLRRRVAEHLDLPEAALWRDSGAA